MKVYIDGEFLEEEKAKISVFDHGFLYGDGVFEGIRVYNKKVFKLKEHIDRLYDSAQAILIKIPLSKKEMIQAVVNTCAKNQVFDNGYIRLIISRGVGDLGLNPLNCKKSSVIIIASEISLYAQELYDKGLKIVTVPTRRNFSESLSPRVKSLNYLNNILAKIEALNSGVEEAVMINQQGYVAECTGDNIFYIKGNDLVTPSADMGILEGITRNVVMELAAENGMNVSEKPFTRYDLYTADECFLTGSAAEIVPVVEIDRREISDAKVGEQTKKLIKLFKNYVKTTGEEIL